LNVLLITHEDEHFTKKNLQKTSKLNEN